MSDIPESIMVGENKYVLERDSESGVKTDGAAMWQAGKCCEFLVIDSLLTVVSCSDDSELCGITHSSGNYYNPEHREIVERWAKGDRFAALVRQYALSVHGHDDGCYRIQKWCGYKILEDPIDGIGGVSFETKEQAQSCLDWVLEQVKE